MNDETLAVWLLAAVTLAFLLGFWFLPGGVLALRRKAHGEMQVDLRPAYSPDTLYRLLGLYGADGVLAFRRLLLADMVFLLVYATFLVLLGAEIARAHPDAPRASSILPVAAIAAASFDYLENLFLLQVVSRMPQRQLLAARVAGISTSLKTLSLLTALVSLFGVLLSPRAG